jgi:hypothetical protein
MAEEHNTASGIACGKSLGIRTPGQPLFISKSSSSVLITNS